MATTAQAPNPTPFKQETPDEVKGLTILFISEHMQTYLDDLLATSVRNLSHRETELENHLADLMVRFGTRLRGLEGADLVARLDLVGEELEIAEIGQDEGESDGTRIVSLGDLVGEYDVLIRRRSEVLDGLWEEWAGVQRELVCLAVEVCGGEGLGRGWNGGGSSEIGKLVGEAVGRFEAGRKRMEEAVATMVGIQGEVDQASEEAVGRLNEQLQGIKLGQKRKREALQKALDAFNEE